MGLSNGDLNQQKAASFRVWLLPIAVVCVSGALMAGDDLGREWLRYDRQQLADFQFWRLLSGHFVHLGLSHYVLNAIGLLLVWQLVGNQFSRGQWLWVALGSIAAMDLGFWLLEPQLTWYVGLSGLLHGILAAGIVGSWNSDRRMALVLAVVVVLKLAYEQLAGPLPGSEATSGGAVVVVAHLYGAIGGVFTAAILETRLRRLAESG